ncbi:RimK family alpha-L-glutamate ligase [Sporosarcina sp. Te-1]|uniref:ATP-grasp domain-containing protein n=1 Tax=Sporosarcina sp. Te-1 TaxID=2818390 RepID=UPI001A9F6759|nr:ATP-grasp domain-containing protein [Sporosarcina sp. Te-1]QTD41563.1 ATP-grasp domain-containing protein [Sporosarcina sp. Te-1]
MKGCLYYSSAEAERNNGFIDDLIGSANRLNMELTVMVDEEQPAKDSDFILFRDRNPLLSAKWEAEGFRLFNRSEVNRIANDKLRTYELAAMLGIPAVPTQKATSVNDLASFPIVLKTRDGHGGHEVSLCGTKEEAVFFFNEHAGRQLIFQPYIESNSTDIRVFMLGNEVLGAVKRMGKNSFKSNYTLGGSVERYSLSTTEKKEVQTIAKALKSDYIGIDFLLLPDGSWLLNEVEDPVGARSLYITHDVSPAAELMQYVKRKLEDEVLG